MEKGVYMTEKDINRHKICTEIAQNRISQTHAAHQLQISLKQMYRIYKNFKKQGVAGIVSKKKGKPSNHQLNPFIKCRVLELVTCEDYNGFGPTFMCERLHKSHGIRLSVETTRQLMIQSGVWKDKEKRRPVIHQQRKRRAHCGELIQVDGSPHAWFEDRRDPCVLIVFIDDATGRTFGQFFESETTAAYMITLRSYIINNGVPLAIYSDKYSVFRVNKPGCLRKECITQFGRALKELKIELICANSPQAKGRVERANQTLQDRLVKELRLAKINSIDDANKFLDVYWEEYNKKFEKLACNPKDYHRRSLSMEDLDKILCIKEKRKVSKNLEIQYKTVIYQIEAQWTSIQLIKAEVEIWEDFNKKIISINYKGKALQYREYGKQRSNGSIVDSKEIDRFFNIKYGKKKISHDHPWLKEGRAEVRKRRYLAATGGGQ